MIIMKRMMFFILFLFYAGNMMGTWTATIGTGTSITSGGKSDITPYKSRWMDAQDQILFTASELQFAGLVSGNIYALAFNVGAADGATLNSFTISVQQIAGTTLSSFLTSDWTTCFSGNVVASIGWNTYTFTTPFNWDGSSSLVFKVCFDNSSYTSNSHVYYTTNPQTGAHYYWFGDLSTSSGCNITSATSYTNRPNVQITGTDYPPILSVTPGSLDFGSAFVGNSSSEKCYLLEGYALYPESGYITVTPPLAFEVSLTHGGPYSADPILVPYSDWTLVDSIYIVFLPTVMDTMYSGNISNSGGYAPQVNVAVKGWSRSEALSMPYCQYFPDGNTPSGWHQTYTGNIPSDRWTFPFSSNAGGSANEAKCTYTNNSAYGISQLITPPITTTNSDTIILAFRQKFEDYSYGGNLNIKVMVRYDGAEWNEFWFHAAGMNSDIPTQLTELKIPVWGASVAEIAWTVDGDHYNFSFWFIDDVCITCRPLHDVRTLSIDGMPAIIAVGSTITPKATVINSGANPETFDVTMTTTGGYASTVSGVSLASSAQAQITFTDWTPEYGNYSVQVCTQLTGDLDPGNDCLTQPVKSKPPARIYGYICSSNTTSLPDGPAWFYDTNPQAITSLAESSNTNDIVAGTWANGAWYASEWWDDTYGGGWYTIDTATGIMTRLADLGRSFSGLAYDLTSEIMYGVDVNNITGYNDIFTIVPATGESTLLGSVLQGEQLLDLAADGSGYLYAIGLETDHLFKIDPSGPTVTDVGTCGINMNYYLDLEYDHSGNTLYASTYTNTRELYCVDMSTGTCTPVNVFMGEAEIGGVAVPYCISGNQWTGNVSTDWSDPANWTCGEVPGSTDKVVISITPSGGRFPVINNGVVANCYHIFVAPGADVKVKTGGTLNVVNP
jgi:hypothetical protein